MRACRGGEYTAVCGKILKAPIVGSKSFVDNSKVSDHHAIIPTEQGVRMSELEYGERKIYELVVSRFLAALLPPCEYEDTQVTAECGGELFIIRGKRILKAGWREVQQLTGFCEEEEEEGEQLPGFGKEQVLPAFEKGQKIAFSKGRITEGKTSPPKPFTEATLLAAMETAGNKEFEEDTEKKGLGTPVTRAPAALERLPPERISSRSFLTAL